MKITVTRDHIRRSKPTNSAQCVCALAISEHIGRDVSIFMGKGHIITSGVEFTSDRKDIWFERRNLFLFKFLQWPGSFEIYGQNLPKTK